LARLTVQRIVFGSDMDRTPRSCESASATLVDDEASQPISAGSAPFTGSYQPEQPLSALDGKNAQGTWRLFIQDTNPFVNNGTLNSWSIKTS
jgi:Proprotein convertase P-domain